MVTWNPVGLSLDILLVEDEESLALTLADHLRDQGHRVFVRREVPAALAWLESNPVDMVLTDVRLPGGSGMQVLERALRLDPPAWVLVMTGYATVSDAVDAMQAGAKAYLQKPFPAEALLSQVAQFSEFREMQARLATLENNEEDDQNLTGDSTIVRGVRKKMLEALGGDGPILLIGESGTGKERAARWIHNSSRRPTPFVPFACGAVPDTLLESSLFGHVKGAFTDADEDSPGLLHQVKNGTLFLDGLQDLSESAQATLLRFLQERTYSPLGTTEERAFSGRILAAVQPQALDAGAIREDLIHRLAVLPILIPPLRDRIEDVPLLVSRLLHRYDPEGRRKPAKKALDALMAFDWPGNVRELENAVHRGITLVGNSKVIYAEHFFPGGVEGETGTLDMATALRLAETDAIKKALRSTQGKKMKAAELLGISRKVLWQRMKVLGIGEES